MKIAKHINAPDVGARQDRGSDARVVTKHAGADSVGATKRRSGHKLGKRLHADIVGEGPKKPPNVFDAVDTGLSDTAQAATFNATGGRY